MAKVAPQYRRGKPPTDPDARAEYDAHNAMVDAYNAANGLPVRRTAVLAGTAPVARVTRQSSRGGAGRTVAQKVTVVPGLDKMRAMSEDDDAPAEENETPAEKAKREKALLNEVTERFDAMARMVRGAARGMVRAIIVSGTGGIGKTFNVERVLEAEKEKNDINYRIITGSSITPVRLYETLYRFREENNVLVLDDCDELLFDPDTLNLLKAALDTGKTRKLHWNTLSRYLDGLNIPTSFDFEGSIIFLTNLNFQKIIDKENKQAQHLQALMTRSYYIDLKLHNKRSLMAWVRFLSEKTKLMQNDHPDISDETAAMLLDWLEDHRDQLRELSIRTAKFIANLYANHGKHWEADARIALLK